MTTQVIEVQATTNIVEVLESPIQLVTEVMSNVVSETTSLVQIVDIDATNIDINTSITTREVVEVTLASSIAEPSSSIEVVSETIPVLYGDEEVAYSKRIDFITDNLLYKGEAAPGALTTDAGWRIRKITIGEDGDVTEEWATGNSLFNKVWDNRLSLTYS